MTIQKKAFSLFVMTQKGHAFLDHMIENYKELIGLVVIGSDRNLDDDFSAKIQRLCVENDLSFLERKHFKSLETRYALAVSWRWLLPIPEERLIVFHDSLLPRYRGFAPLVNSLINREPHIGVTALFGSQEYDRGDIIFQSKTNVNYPLTIEQAILLNDCNYRNCLDYICKMVLEGRNIVGVPQVEDDATYSVWRDEYDYKINWNMSASFLRRFVDAVGPPYRGAFTTLDGRVLRIQKVIEMPDVKIENRDVGKILFLDHGAATVICQSGLLKIVNACWEDGNLNHSFYPLKKFRARFE